MSACVTSQPIQQIDFLETFECLGADCPDTCCKGWGMQLDERTRARYQKEAPELLDAVGAGEAEYIMKRDPETDYCIKLEGGLCGIHQKYGTFFLGDACHFYPRVTRALGQSITMTAALSCPEITRLCLFSPADFSWKEVQIERLPYLLKNYSHEEFSDMHALAIHKDFMHSVDASPSAEQGMLRIVSAAGSLEMIEKKSWPDATKFFLSHADARLPEAQPEPNDLVHIVQALMGLMAAAKSSSRPRLEKTVDDMQKALSISIDSQTLTITFEEGSAEKREMLKESWCHAYAAAFALPLKNYLKAQLTMALFPFAGFGHTLSERAVILAVRLATIKLALMALCAESKEMPTEEESICVIQSISRFMDHLSDPAFSFSIYQETGWTRLARLKALLGQ